MSVLEDMGKSSGGVMSGGSSTLVTGKGGGILERFTTQTGVHTRGSRGGLKQKLQKGEGKIRRGKPQRGERKKLEGHRAH